MRHLSPTVLARLVDEPPSEVERTHLASCLVCGEELQALRAQRRTVADLEDEEPPAGAWEALERRLREETLISDRTDPDLVPVDRTRQTHLPSSASMRAAGLRTAAAVLLFASGALVGATLERGLPEGPRNADEGFTTPDEALAAAEELSLDEAADLVTVAHQWHLDALLLYRERLERTGGGAASVSDPVTRFVAIEHLLSATEAAVRENPADPFLNGVLVGAAAERQAALDGISFGAGVP